MKKKKPPRLAQVTRIIHRDYTQAHLAAIGHKIAEERRTGRNVEEREEWRRTWEEYKKGR
jgi:hypothetical protein